MREILTTNRGSRCYRVLWQDTGQHVYCGVLQAFVYGPLWRFPLFRFDGSEYEYKDMTTRWLAPAVLPMVETCHAWGSTPLDRAAWSVRWASLPSDLSEVGDAEVIASTSVYLRRRNRPSEEGFSDHTGSFEFAIQSTPYGKQRRNINT
jgi:hypothetical protein